MDRHLIDFDSPKEKKEQILVPRSATVPSSCVDIVSWSTNDGVNNPFDLVGYQAAANTAAENDPFEMVFNDVLSSQAIRNRQINSVVSKAENVPFRVVNPQSRDAGNTFALLDVNNLSEEETEACNRFVDHSCCEYKESKSGLNSSEDEPHSVNIDKFGVKRMNHTEDWSCLDDIQPPDSFLSSSVDMSDLLDDTVSNSILYLTSETESYLFDEFEREEKNNSTSKQSEVSKSTIPDASFSPEEHLRLIAKKKIDNLIDKAECEVKLHIQDSTEKRRSSIKNLTAPFTLRSIGDHLREPVEHSKCFQKWSKDELEKTIKPSVTTSVDTPNDSCSLALGSIHSAFALKSDFKAVEQDTDACNSSLPIFEDMIHTLHTTHLGDRYGSHYMHSVVNERDLLEGRMDNSVSHPSQQMPGMLFHSSSGEATRSGKELCSVSSPVLPVPLCEDAVRNMSLCCKYSPPKVTWQCNNNVPNVLQCKTVTSKQHKASNENKLVLRKPSEPKARQKLAPMKATAPIQNMTRSRSSLTAHLKAEVVTTFPKKSERKEAPSSVSCMGCPRVPGPPSRTMSRSAPNLASPNSKLPTRLPSPRKASGGLSKPRSFARQVDTVDERRVCVTLGLSPSIHYSPRPLLKHFSSKSLSHPRVLSDINASPTAQKPRKCRNTHVEGTKRVSTSKEKENLL